MLWLWWCLALGQIRRAGRRRRAEKRLRSKLALSLAVELVGGGGVLRIHHRHHELAQHLNLLDLGERDLIAGLDRLQVADRGLILHLSVCSAACSPWKYWACDCALWSAPFKVFSVVSTLACGLCAPGVLVTL